MNIQKSVTDTKANYSADVYNLLDSFEKVNLSELIVAEIEEFEADNMINVTIKSISDDYELVLKFDNHEFSAGYLKLYNKDETFDWQFNYFSDVIKRVVSAYDLYIDHLKKLRELEDQFDKAYARLFVDQI